ncbi:hypothetical protein Dimus_026055 [Dionaea muscipula]
MDAQMGSCCDITLGRVPAMGSSSSLYRRRTRLPIYQSGQVSMISARSESTIKLSSGSETSKLGTNNRMFILGMGYVGQFLAQYMKEDGWAISGTCRSIAKKKELERKGFDVHLFDACDLQCNDIHTLRYCTHLLVSIPPVVPAGDQILQHEELVRKIALMGGNLRWLCYLSSTSVYGDCEGAWVNEDYPPNPTSKLANLRLEAEEGWLKLGTDLGLSTLVLRLGGIYGPGRSAIDTILEQVPLSSEGRKRRVSKRYTSRVHVADICQALKATTAVPISRLLLLSGRLCSPAEPYLDFVSLIILQ